MNKFSKALFLVFVFLVLLTPFMVFKELLFPYVTSKAFYFRILVELALPFYTFLLIANPNYRPKLKNPLTISVLLFWLINLVASFAGVNVTKSIWGNFERMGGLFYLTHLVLLYFYVLMIGQMSLKAFRVFLQAVVSIGVLVSLDGLMVLATHNHFLLSDPSYPRVSGTFGNPIYIASFLVLPMFVAAFLAWQEEVNWKKAVYWLSCLFQLIIIFTSGTRGAVVGLGIGIFIASVLYVIFTPSRKLKVRGGAAIGVLIVLAALLFSFHNSFPQGSMLRRVSELRDSNSKARIIQWGVALKGFKNYPVLGVGPENYYYLSNKYYNPEIYPYDASWFDKPHNYPLEILVTSGVFGIAAYLAMLVFCVLALWKAYKADIIALGEFCLLVCGLIVYEVQNLFVFDTVASSVVFFVFVGLCAYLWHEATAAVPAENKKRVYAAKMGSGFAYASFGVATVLAIYCLVVANIQPMEVGKAVNYGYAYSGVDPQASQVYFKRAVGLPFNFDPIQTSNKYSDFAVGLALNPGTQTQDFVNQNLQDAINYQESVVAKIPTDPTAYQELANSYLTVSILSKQPLNVRAQQAADAAVALAPGRPEPLLIQARLQIAQNQNDAAINTLKGLVTELPSNNEAKIQLAILYYYTGKVSEAVALGQGLVDKGYAPGQASQLSWLGQAYETLNDLPKAINTYEYVLAKVAPDDINVLWLMAQAQAKAGDKAAAIATAQKLISLDSQDAPQFQSFINSLK